MSSEILEDLAKSVQQFDLEGAASLAQQAIDTGVDPYAALETLTATIREIGDAFGRDECFLPELVGAADAMQGAMVIIEDAIKKKGKKRVSAGRIVVGTVAGDIHNIGKSILATLLTADGFEVIDLGIDVPVEKFVNTVEKESPDLLAMSALLTITAREQKNVIEGLIEKGIRDGLKVMVGGGAINEEFAERIGADGYDPTAPGGVSLAKRLIGA